MWGSRSSKSLHAPLPTRTTEALADRRQHGGARLPARPLLDVATAEPLTAETITDFVDGVGRECRDDPPQRHRLRD